MDNGLLEIEAQYSEALQAPVRITTLTIHGDSEAGQLTDVAGSLFDFEYHPDSDELYYQFNEQMTEDLKDGANGFLISSGYIDNPREDAAAFLRGMSEYFVNQDAALKCGSKSQACGSACIPKSSKCRKGRGGASLQQGGKKRRGLGTGAKIGLGAAGVAALGAAGAGALAYGTKSGRAELAKGKESLKNAKQEMEDMENQAKTAINLTGEAGEQRRKEVKQRYVQTGMGGIKAAVGSIGRAVKAGGQEVGSRVKSKAGEAGSTLKSVFSKGEKEGSGSQSKQKEERSRQKRRKKNEQEESGSQPREKRGKSRQQRREKNEKNYTPPRPDFSVPPDYLN